MNHCRKITASDVAKLGVQSKALVPETPTLISTGFNSSNGVVNSVVNHASGEPPFERRGSNARLSDLEIDTEVFDC
jgi:hypothetical protein